MNLRYILVLTGIFLLEGCEEPVPFEPGEYVAELPSKVYQGFGYFFQNKTYTIGNSLVLHEDGHGVMVSCVPAYDHGRWELVDNQIIFQHDSFVTADSVYYNEVVDGVKLSLDEVLEVRSSGEIVQSWTVKINGKEKESVSVYRKVEGN